MPRPLDIHWVHQPLNEATYKLPCVITQQDQRGISVLLLSTKIQTYFKPGQDFLIDSADPDFPATGLEVSSFVIGQNEYDVLPYDLGGRMGSLTGDLARRFLQWYG